MRIAGVFGVAVALLTACGDDATDGATSHGSQSGASEGTANETSNASTSGDETQGDEDVSTSEASATEGSTGDPSTGEQPEVCAQMFACLGVVAPELAAPLLALYGEQGSCWELGADEQAICEAACEGQLQIAYEMDLWDQQACSGRFQPEPTGEPGPESTDAACSDGFDNDGDTFIDCDDFECTMNPSVTVCGADTD